MKILAGKTIADVNGIETCGIACGIKKDNKKDLCIIYSKFKTTSAAVFTSNKVKAAPILLDMENIKNENTQAIVINSGNANSCTGDQGLENAKKMADTTAKCLNLSPKEVLVASTGALSVQLPMEAVIPGIKKACRELSGNSGLDAAEAILTSDINPKTIAVEFYLQGKRVTMAGMTKGSTMIHPNMGTTLSFIVTDTNISKPLLHKALKESVEMSFNMVSIDGDTSTNDMAAILANGTSGINPIDSINEDYETFSEALNFVTVELAKMLAKDGDGSTKFIEAEVINASTLKDARAAARAVISSNILKCQCFRNSLKPSTIVYVLGYANIDMKNEYLDISIGNENDILQIVKGSLETEYDKYLFNKILSGNLIKILIDLKNGRERAAGWGCDLTYEYIKKNGVL